MTQRPSREERRERKQRLNPGVLKPGFDPGALPAKRPGSETPEKEDVPESSVHDVEKAVSGKQHQERHPPKGGLEFDERGAWEKPSQGVEP